VRIRGRLRWLLIGVTLLAVPLAVAATLHVRAQRFKHLAAYHLQVEAVLFEQSGALGFYSHGLDETEEFFRRKGPEARRTYKASLYHSELADNYRLASQRPWRPVSADPPPPAGANQRFVPEPRFAEEIDECESNHRFH
jgi:hypothetical protein